MPRAQSIPEQIGPLEGNTGEGTGRERDLDENAGPVAPWPFPNGTRLDQGRSPVSFKLDQRHTSLKP